MHASHSLRSHISDSCKHLTYECIFQIHERGVPWPIFQMHAREVYRGIAHDEKAQHGKKETLVSQGNFYSNAYLLAFHTLISLTPLAPTMLLVIISDISRSLALAPSNKKTLQTHMIKIKYAIHVRLRMREVSHSYSTYPTLKEGRVENVTWRNRIVVL